MEPQIGLFNAGKGQPHWFEDYTIYKIWEDLLQMSNPKAADAQLRKIGNYKFENFEVIPHAVQDGVFGSVALIGGTGRAEGNSHGLAERGQTADRAWDTGRKAMPQGLGAIIDRASSEHSAPPTALPAAPQ